MCSSFFLRKPNPGLEIPQLAVLLLELLNLTAQFAVLPLEILNLTVQFAFCP
jgi:hypothetical protein